MIKIDDLKAKAIISKDNDVFLYAKGSEILALIEAYSVLREALEHYNTKFSLLDYKARESITKADAILNGEPVTKRHDLKD